MKKFIYYIIYILIAFIGISCDKIEDPWGEVIPPTLSAYTPEFGSKTSDTRSSGLWEYQPENWDGPASLETRTFAIQNPSVSDEYIQYWSMNDAISLFFTTANLQYQLSSFKDDDNDGYSDYGHFELVGSASEGTQLTGNYYYSVYPYKESTSINYESGVITYNFPKNQHYVYDSYSKDENGMVAREPKEGGDNVLYFQNFCSYLQLRLVDSTATNAPKYVKQITLAANNPDDKMAGEAAISYDGDAPVVNMKMTAGNQIVLDCGNGVELSRDTKSPSKFWFVLPGDIVFTSGFSITVTFTDNTYFEKSTTKQISIARSHIKPMAPFSPDDDNDDIVLTGPIRYKYEDPYIDEPYPLSNTFYGVNGEVLKIIDQKYDQETGEWVVLLSGTLKTIGGNSFKESDPDLEYIIVDNDSNPVIISDFAFYNCTAESIEIYNDVESINESAFENAYTTSLHINGNIETLKSNLGSGSYIEEIIVEGDIKTIEEFAFMSCSDLQRVVFDSVETVGYRAFYQCSNLSDINLSSVKYIEDGAFRNCRNLQSVSLDSIITIGDNAFMGCSKLTSAIISENCTMIGEGAFCNASRLQKVSCYAVLPPFIKTDNADGSYVFDGTHKNLVIYIPDGSMDNYTDPNYFVNNPSGYTSPVQSTVNWWYQEYTGKLRVMTNSVEQL